MKKLRIYRQRFLLLHLVCIACGVFFTAVNLDIPYESLFERQIDAFYFTANVENLISLILMFLPHIMIIALLADLFLQDIGIEATYCLTRFDDDNSCHCLLFRRCGCYSNSPYVGGTN